MIGVLKFKRLRITVGFMKEVINYTYKIKVQECVEYSRASLI